MSSEIEVQAWSSNEYTNLALVQEVKKHPCLYNNTIPEYSQKDLTAQVWQDIAEKFGCTVPAIRNKWKSMRAVYIRSKLHQCRGERKSKHYMDKHLSFLLPFTTSRKLLKEFAKLNKQKSVVDFTKEQTTSHEVENTIAEASEVSTDNNKESGKYSLKINPRRIKAVKPTVVKSVGPNNPVESSENRQNNPSEIHYIAPLEIQKDNLCVSIADSEDFRKQFMMSLLPEIEEMPESKFRSLKRQILDLIDEVKADE